VVLYLLDCSEDELSERRLPDRPVAAIDDFLAQIKAEANRL
jgi:hypothetical protein